MPETLSQFQQSFLDQIKAPEQAQCAAIRIYQNNYFFGLIEVLATAYPLTLELLGEGSFKAFARDYVRQFPPQETNRNRYGAYFSQVLQDHTALTTLSWLSDFARFEWAAHLAHHADESAPCTPQILMDMNSKITLHPSVSVLKLNYSVSTLYFTLLVGMEATAPEQNSLCLLVGRDQNNALYSLPIGAFYQACIDSLLNHHSLAKVLLELTPSPAQTAELQSFLGQCLQDGILTPYQTLT